MMKLGQRYRIKSQTIALASDEGVGRRVAITIPEGGIVEITDGPNDGSDSLHVRWEGKECQMFTRDLRERSEEMKSAGDRLPF
jgi:hypothetical protein